nr:hypothetical protein [Pseudomonas sp. ANT_J28]
MASRLLSIDGVEAAMALRPVDEALYLSDRVLVMDNRPGSIRQALAVQLAHPRRDRRDPLLARLNALSLTELQRAHVI